MFDQFKESKRTVSTPTTTWAAPSGQISGFLRGYVTRRFSGFTPASTGAGGHPATRPSRRALCADP